MGTQKNSQLDSSFKHPKLIFKLMDKKNLQFYTKKIVDCTLWIEKLCPSRMNSEHMFVRYLFFPVMTLETPHDLAITPEKASNSSDSVEARSHDNKENRSPDYQANDGSLDLAANARDQKANDLVENLSSGKGLAVNKRSPASPPKPDEVETFIDGQLNGSQRLLTRLKTDLPFRRRYFHTIWVCWGFVVLVGHQFVFTQHFSPK